MVWNVGNTCVEPLLIILTIVHGPISIVSIIYGIYRSTKGVGHKQKHNNLLFKSTGHTALCLRCYRAAASDSNLSYRPVDSYMKLL